MEANEIKILRKILGKTKNTIRSQEIREPCGIQPINESVKRRRREWDEHVTRMDAERLVKQYICRKISRMSKKKLDRLNPSSNQAELPITRRRRISRKYSL